MKVQVRYFASLREALGSGESVELAPGTTLASLRDQLCASSTRHAEMLARPRPIRCAMERQLCDETAVARDGAEVAFFPPVTGG